MARTKPATILAIAASLAITASASAAVGPGRWYDVGAGVNGQVFALHSAGGSLYMGGNFTNAGGNANADRIARWNGTAWKPVGAGLGTAMSGRSRDTAPTSSPAAPSSTRGMT